MTSHQTQDVRPQPQADPRRWAGLAVLAGSLLVVVMDMTILNVAVPALAADLRPSSTQLLWIVDSYSLVIAGLLVTVAALGDRWGRRRMLLTGYAVFAAASLLVLVASTPWAVVAVRALLGVGGAMIMPSTLASIRTLFPDPRERATALGLWGATAGVGGGLGPIVGGLLLENFSWHAAFLVNVPVMLVAIVAAWILLPESRAARPAPLDAPAAAGAGVGLVALVYAIKHLSKEGLTVPSVAAAVVAVVALTWFVRRCLRRPEPVLDVRLFTRRPFTAGVLAALLTSLAMAGAMLLGAQWLQLVEGLSPIRGGVALLPAAIGGAVAAPLAPSLAARVGVRPVLAGGLAVGGLGFSLLFWAPQPLEIPWAAVAFALVGISTGSLAIASALIMGSAPADRAGNAAAIEEVSYEVGAALGVATLGSAAAGVYRGDLPVAQLREAGLPDAALPAVQDSIGGALTVAQQLGPAGQAVADLARTAFTDAFTKVGLLGGLLMLVAAAAVWLLTPRDLDLADGHH